MFITDNIDKSKASAESQSIKDILLNVPGVSALTAQLCVKKTSEKVIYAAYVQLAWSCFLYFYVDIFSCFFFLYFKQIQFV